MKNVFNGIPAKNLEKIEKIVARLNKKGYPTTLTIDNLYEKNVPVYEVDEHRVEHKLNQHVSVQVVDISLDSENIELGQWDIMGVKENVLGVAIYYGTIPEQYHNDDFICEHCNSHRHRNKVVILKHKETGELKQVGTTCLQDFTGVETSRFGSLLDELHRITINDTMYVWDNTPNKKYVCAVKRILYIAYRVMLKYGYAKRWNIYDGEKPANYIETRERVFDIYHSTNADAADANFATEDIDESIMENILNAYKDFVAKKDYIDNFTENVLNLLNMPYIPTKFMNYIVFVPSFYLNKVRFEARKQKAQEKREEELKSINNEYAGAVGDKITTEATLTRYSAFDGQYGLMYVYNFKDVQGHVLVWFTSKALKVDAGVDEGDTITIKGTIKKLSEYKGIKQTVLTRCKVK